MLFLRQSTAVDVALGPFLDSTDGVTAETGLTIAQADVRLKKGSGAWAQVNDATSATHEENGWYEKELDATDTNTVGILLIAVHEAGALPVWHEFTVLEEAVYDMLFAASALGYIANAPVNVAQFGGSNLTATGGRPEVNVSHWLGTAAATPTVAGVPEVDVTHWIGTAAATPSVAGVPEVDLTHVAGSTTSVSTLASSVATLLAAIGAINDAAADGDPTNTDTAMAYLKQLINVLIGTTGIVTFPSSATPANNVSLAEVIRQIYDEVAGLNGGTPLDAAGVRSAVGLASANLDTQLSGIQADTDDIQTRLPAALVSGRIDASVGAMAANTLTASAINSDAITAAKVASDVTDEIWAKAMTEPAAVPAVNGTAIAALSWLLALARNRMTQTSTVQTLRNDANNADIATSTHSDDGTTHVRGEWA
jgi:hypothetical protein